MKNCKKPTLRMAFGGAFGTIPRGISVGGLRAMNEHEDALRRDATSRYGIDTQSATARMGDATSRYGIDAQSANARLGADTQRYGYDTSAASHRYGVDAQSATARMTDATQRFGIGTQADTSKYGFDASKAASMYGADASKAASMYGADASKAASNFAATTGANASMHNAGLGAQASNFAATTGANASMHNAGLGANASMYNAGLGALASNFAATTGANASMYNAGLGANASMHNAGLAAQSNNFGAITQANASMHNAGLAAQANNYSADSNLLGNMWHMKNGGEVPVRVGLRNGGEIRAMDGFSYRSGATGSFASQAGDIKWLSPKDAIEFSAKMQAVDDAHELQQAQLSAAGGGIHDWGIGGAGVQSPGAQLAQQQANQRWGWEQRDRAYAMQERQRLTGRRNMYDAALAGHFGAGGFGGKMVGAMPVRPQPGFGLPQHSFGLRDGGEINARWGFSDGNIVYKTPLLQAKEDAELAEYEARRKNVEAPRLRDGGEIHANMGYEYLVPDNPERTPGWVQEFNAKGRGAYVGRDKAKANEYAVAKRNAETTDRMASGGAYPGAVSLDAQRNPYKRVTDLENMYDDTGYNPYTGISDPSKKGWGAQWVATSKYRLRDGGDMLQTGMGGDVPGTGKGDKVPAKYEPGEFVVSNDMLDAQPGLRDHLRTLREQVLADKGMTVQEADAKAVGKGRGLRASGGIDVSALYPKNFLDLTNVEPAAAPRASTAAYDAEVTQRSAALRAARERPAQLAAERAAAAEAEASAKAAAATAETAKSASTAVEAAKGSGGIIQGIKDVASLPGKAIDGVRGAVGSGLRAAGEFVAAHPKVFETLASPRLNVGSEMLLHHGELQPGTLPPEIVAAMDKPFDPTAKPFDFSGRGPVAPKAAVKAQAATAEDIGANDPVGAVAPKPVAPSAVTQGERLASDQLTNTVMSRGLRRAGEPTNADINLQRLNSDPAARDTYNKALALRGAGIQVLPGGEGHGPIFTNSTGPEKLRYTGADGAPTNDWAKTKDYAESIGRTQKIQALGDKLENERNRRELQQQEAAMTDAAMNGDNRAAAMLPGLRSLRGEMMKNDTLVRTEADKNAAHLEGIRMQNQGALEQLGAKRDVSRGMEQLISSAVKQAGGNPEQAVNLLSQNGFGDAAETLSNRATADNDRRTKDYENMLKEFKGMVRTPDGNEIPGGAELAADELMKIVKAKNAERVAAGKPPIGNILDADGRAEMMKEATLRARAISGMRAKQSLRDSSIWPWAGLEGAPSGIVPSAKPERVGFWNGLATGGDVARGDYEYGKYYLPQGVGQDVIDYLKGTAIKHAGGNK